MRVGIVLSVVVIAAAVVYATRPDRYPDLAFIADFVALASAVVGLAVVWLGVLVASLVTRARDGRRAAP